MKRAVMILLAALALTLSVAAQNTGAVMTLQQVIDTALANGDDSKVLQGNLDVARAQHALNVSKNSFTLGGSAGLGQTQTFPDNSTLLPALKAATGASTTPLVPQAAVSLVGPLTSVSLSSTPYAPASPPTTQDATSLVSVTVSQTIWNGYWGGPTQATVDKSILARQGTELPAESGRSMR